MPEELSKINSMEWLNAWAISLDPSKWKTEKLFYPKNKPRQLDLVRQQIWEAMGR